MSLRYGIIGTGAIGGYYGGKLAHNGKDVHFLFHSDYDFVKRNGLQIDSVDGDFHLSDVNAYSDTIDMPPCDVVFVCLKSINNVLLKKMLPPILHPQTLVVLIQNGIGLEADLQNDFPDLSIAAGLAFICSGKVGKAHIHHQCYGRLTIAPYSCKNTALIDEILSDLNQSGVKAVTAAYGVARWKKAVWNIPFNGMTVALNTMTDKLLQHPATERLIYEMMLEVIRAANKVGVESPISETFADEMIASTKVMTPYSPSMKLDFDYHRPLEIYYIYSRPIEEAKKAGYDMTRVSVLEKELRFIESSYLHLLTSKEEENH
jgi:2-dehydropantoate 2-reductase